MPDGDTPHLLDTAEGQRLKAVAEEGWHRWGPYLSERQWGTVREDYSPDGKAWGYLPHDHARSRAYRWGEDGIAGFSDDRQLWCLALALWNGRDPILKERFFGLTGEEGNHGEDVKELYWYLDATPTHSYMRMLYKYPQGAFPYARLVSENGARRGDKRLPEFELIDTRVFDEDRYFDVTIEYAKAAPDDIRMRVTVRNHGPEAVELHVLPQLWSRNTWSWAPGRSRPNLRLVEGNAVEATRKNRPSYRFTPLQPAEFLFTENDTNTRRLFGSGGPGHFKDAFDAWLVRGEREAVNPLHEGTKCAALSTLQLGPGESIVLRYRLAPAEAPMETQDGFDAVFAQRIAEADAFYAALQHGIADPDARMVQRQALAGMLWSKQYYHFDVHRWLAGDPAQPPPPPGRRRNAEWDHLNNADIVSMPDKWEYPWYAAWDLAFHCVTLALVDPAFAKGQLILLTREWYMHPNGQLPAYEWAFSDANPPVHAWAAWRVYRMDQALTGKGDRAFLERVFHKLMLNFTWWVNRKDAQGHNIFQGGFLGLDNIGVFDRSNIPEVLKGSILNQVDGTAWMAMYTLDLLRIALELAREDDVYEDIATKFFEHFLYIAEAINRTEGEIRLWNEEDAFFYDLLQVKDGPIVPMMVRSVVGLIPLCAVHVFDQDNERLFPAFMARARWMMTHRPDLTGLVSRWTEPGKGGRTMLSLLRRYRLKALLARVLDETEFLSDFGVRSLSKAHAAQPFAFEWGGARFSVDYEPAESTTWDFGGNSNWRGPIWLPINYLLIEALYEFERFHGDDFKVECPTGSGRFLSLPEVAAELTRRLTRLVLRDGEGRPVFGEERRFQGEAFRDLVPFHEYFHGDTGKGLGAAHQTGWTGLLALLLHPRQEVFGCRMPVAPAAP